MSTVENIKTLREKTGAGLGACKAALAESNNDIEAAVICLRKKGLADMAKRAGRETKEGMVCVKTSADHVYTAMAYLGCETDFVAKTPDFKALVEKIADYMLAHPQVADYTADEELKKIITEVAPKFGENVSLTKAVCWKLSGYCGIINYYIHTDNKKAAMVEMAPADGKCNCHCENGGKEAMRQIVRDVALQAVGMVAQYLDEADVPADVIEKEKDIAITQAKNEGKNDATIEKMLPGRIKKFLKDVALLDQPSMKDSKLSVREYVAAKTKEVGTELKVVRFVRF
ncbi:MAG: translation elongation factor Ts [Elusimicrobiota bacterium]|jgi:elongation factor Ts|nr:translation elongation factor Ts [Elusimicrobiota bacterium]